MQGRVAIFQGAGKPMELREYPQAWPHVKPLLRRALEMRRQIARGGWWN